METSSKQLAIKFLQAVVAGNIDEAFADLIDPEGKHHNAFFPAGFEALKHAMKEHHARFPQKQLIIKHVLQDGDFVVIHSELHLAAEQETMITVHLFRFKNEKIVELWDCGQPIPVNSPNQDGV